MYGIKWAEIKSSFNEGYNKIIKLTFLEVNYLNYFLKNIFH